MWLVVNNLGSILNRETYNMTPSYPESGSVALAGDISGGAKVGLSII
jgi:histidine ammonia-lyase